METHDQFISSLFNSSFLQKSLEIATKAHGGQKRTDGKDYITHPIEVTKIAAEKYLPMVFSSNYGKRVFADNQILFENYFTHMVKVCCVDHDILEDCKDTTIDNLLDPLETLYDLNFVSWSSFRKHVTGNLYALNKNNYSNYYDYIIAISNCHMVSIVTKLADIDHNEPTTSEGHRKDKYKLARHILAAEFRDRLIQWE